MLICYLQNVSAVRMKRRYVFIIHLQDVKLLVIARTDNIKSAFFFVALEFYQRIIPIFSLSF